MRSRRPERARSTAAQRLHLVGELAALRFHLVEDGAVVGHHLLRRALQVLRVAQALVTRRDLFVEIGDLGAQTSALAFDVDESSEEPTA